MEGTMQPQGSAPSSGNHHWKVLGAAVIVLVILGIVLAFTRHAASPTTPSSQAIVTNVDFSRLPEKFPSNVPFFSQYQVLQNFNVDRGATIEATRKYASQAKMDVLFDSYKKFFTYDKWELSGFTMSHPVASGITFYGKKDGATLLAHLNYDPKNPSFTQASLSFVFPK